ncbi:MAG TPA: hypothetical protein ENJ32_00660 [Crenotrichaceae bacterium]|nr:hypothetical protein [Crenotrichaceae bacterium]
MTEPSAPCSSVQIRNGNLYLDAATYQTFFNGIESVILVNRQQKLYIMPVMNPGGGGLLIKIINSKGDRVIHAREFFCDQQVDESLNLMLPAYWNTEMAALEIGIQLKLMHS